MCNKKMTCRDHASACPFRLSPLAGRTNKRRAFVHETLNPDPAPVRTEFAFLLIHLVPALELSPCPIRRDKTANRRASHEDRFLQHALHGFKQYADSSLRQPAPASVRMDTGSKQHFVGVDVPDAGDPVLIQQRGLDPPPAGI